MFPLDDVIILFAIAAAHGLGQLGILPLVDITMTVSSSHYNLIDYRTPGAPWWRHQMETFSA